MCLLNQERARHGLPMLRYNGLLELASQRHSEDMAVRNFFAHDTPDGVDPQARMAATGDEAPFPDGHGRSALYTTDFGGP